MYDDGRDCLHDDLTAYEIKGAHKKVHSARRYPRISLIRLAELIHRCLKLARIHGMLERTPGLVRMFSDIENKLE